MRLLSLFVILCPIIFFFLTTKKKDLFYPPTAFSFLYTIKIVIPTIIYCFNANIRIANDVFLEKSLSNDDVFFKHAILQSIGYYMVLCGMKFICLKNPSNSIYFSKDKNKCIRYKVWGYTFLILGAMGFFLIMSKVGGVVFFFSNLGERTFLVRDLDFETHLLSFLNYAPLVIIYSKKWTKESINLIDILIITLAGLMVGLGGRKALIMLFIESAIIYHYVVAPIKIKKILNAKVITVLSFILIFFSTYSKLRTPGAFEEFMSNPVSFYLEKNEGGLLKTIAGESYVPFYVSIVDYFDNHEKWGGSSFASLPSAFIPSSIYPAKPPVDDGMYLYSIAHGGNVSPPMPAKSLDGTSWPLETFGAMYANFGSLGVICGLFLLGCIISFWFNKMIISDYKFKYVIFYILLLFTFEISTLRIVQVIISFALLSFVQFLIEKKHD